MWPLVKRLFGGTTRLTRSVLLLAGFFAVDKVVAFVRQVIIARQFGLSSELDVFNVANNIPDMISALISGGAIAMALIPVLAEVRTRDGQAASWNLFSRVANLAFLVAAVVSLLAALLAGPLVRWELGVAPGFSAEQQQLVVELMRLDLIATLIFALSGMAIAGLQANQHFLLPALAPILYNVGQIFGALILAPMQGYQVGGVTLPALGLGVHGLVYGVLLGAGLHLGIQIPGLLRFGFRWTASLRPTPDFWRVLLLLLPRLISMGCVQLIFLVRDNLASRLDVGSVSALTYGWMIFQLPETLIGTAVGVAILPTLAEMFSQGQEQAFGDAVQRAVQVLLALTLPVAAVFGLALRPLLVLAFRLDAAGADVLLWVSRMYLLGLAGQCLMEVASRSFYARQWPWPAMAGALLNLALFSTAGVLLFRPLGASGIALADAIAYTVQAVVLLLILGKRMGRTWQVSGALLRSLLAAFVGGAVVLLVAGLGKAAPLPAALVGMALGGGLALALVWKDFRLVWRM